MEVHESAFCGAVGSGIRNQKFMCSVQITRVANRRFSLVYINEKRFTTL